MFIEQVENLDRLLDQLEELARGDLSSARFLNMLVEQVRLTVVAQSAQLLLPAAQDQWLAFASSGAICSAAQQAAVTRIADVCDATPEALTGTAEGHCWQATPLRPRNYDRGCLLTVWADPLPPHTAAGISELLNAFAEIVAIRQQTELESLLGQTWDQVQELTLQLDTTEELEQAAALLVNGLTRLLGAARVSLVSTAACSKPHVLAISGIPRPNPQANILPALQKIAHQVVSSGRPTLREQSTPGKASAERPAQLAEDGCFANLLALQLTIPSNSPGHSPSKAASVAIIEFSQHEEMVRSATRLSQSLPLLAVAWERHQRWLRLPRFARWWTLEPSPRLSAAFPWLRRCLMLVVVGALGWLLMLPTPLVIEAEGAYEPVTTRDIFASHDGFIEQLLVDDGSPVTQGQPLARLRSPALELQIEQTEGSARATLEEITSTRIALNQLSPEAPDVLSQQSRLAGRIAELEKQQQSLQAQLQLLEQARNRLLLISPIAGNVIAKDLQRNLAGRPVRRGEPLFSVVDQAGPWQIRVQVADRDAGYMLSHFSKAVPGTPHSGSASAQPPPIEFCLASDPDQRFAAHIRWIADYVENRHGEGCSLEVRATVDPSASVTAHTGTGVYCFFECGQQPLWFVWCRPLVEAVQRRWWFHEPK